MSYDNILNEMCQLAENVKLSLYNKHILQGAVCDSTIMSFVPEPHIKKISKNEYIKIKRVKALDDAGQPTVIVYSDGVVHEMKNSTDRNKRSLRKVFVDLRHLITTNFTESDKGRQLFLTLTYTENMTDDKQCYRDFDVFRKRLYRHYAGHKLDYITIVEPQGRGAWHIHMLLKSDKPLDIDEYSGVKFHEMWGHGYVTAERLNDIDHIGAYFIAYFSNVEITPENEAEYEGDIVERNGKRFIKGERLRLYPDYMKIYRTSKGIVKPSIEMGDFPKGFPIVAYKQDAEIDTGYVDKFGNPGKLKITKVQRKKGKGE